MVIDKCSTTIRIRACCSSSRMFVKAFISSICFAGAPGFWQRSHATIGFATSGFPMIRIHLHGAADSA